MTPEEIESTVFEQIERLNAVVLRLGGEIVHVKPHGALYNVAVRSEPVGAGHRQRRGQMEPAHPTVRSGAFADARRVARDGSHGRR